MVGAKCSRSDAGPPPALALEFDADDLACAAQHGLREDLVTSRPAFDGMPCLVLLGLVLVLVRALHDFLSSKDLAPSRNPTACGGQGVWATSRTAVETQGRAPPTARARSPITPGP
jgi:hypothetical protein